MYRIDNASSVAVKPAYAGAGTPNQYFDNGTVWDHDFANHLQEELASIATLKGAALSKAADTQCATALNGIQALASGATDTGVADSYHARAILACNDSRATGVDSVCIASSGTQSGGQQLASGNRSAIIASDVPVGFNMTAQGDQSFIAASATSLGAILVSGDNSAVIASLSAGGAITVAGNQSATIASNIGSVAADYSAFIASNLGTIAGTFSYSASIASRNSNVGANYSAAIGSDTADIDHDHVLALASVSPGTSPGAQCIYGGSSTANKWFIYSSTGQAFFNGDLQAKGTAVNFLNLPESATGIPVGLASGDLWIDTSGTAGVNRIVMSKS